MTSPFFIACRLGAGEGGARDYGVEMGVASARRT
jgi:hypothetical protein